MVHRDIKPDNIGVNDGEAYLADFGEAESTDGMLGNGLFSGLVKWSWVAIESFLLDAGPGYQEQLCHPYNEQRKAVQRGWEKIRKHPCDRWVQFKLVLTQTSRESNLNKRRTHHIGTVSTSLDYTRDQSAIPGNKICCFS